jgi:hypothetical protein
MMALYRSIKSALNVRGGYSAYVEGFWYLYHHI